MSEQTNTRIAIIGAGGLGGPIAMTLSASGYSHLTLYDGDAIELSNLPRQIQFSTDDVGASKARRLAAQLIERYVSPDALTSKPEFVDDNVVAEVTAHDIVIDGSDSPSLKFALNDLCVQRGTPFVIAAITRYCGHIFCWRPGQAGCYRCVFEAPTGDDFANSCTSEGVLGPSVGLVAASAVRASVELLSSTPTSPQETNHPRQYGAQLLSYADTRLSTRPRVIEFDPRADCSCQMPAGSVYRSLSCH